MKAFISVAKGKAGNGFFDEETVRFTDGICQAVYNPYDRHMTADEVAEMIGDSDVYVTGWGSAELCEKILAKAPNLKLLAHVGGTVYGYVTPEMWERGIRVISGNELMAESVAEGTLAYILAAYRDIPGYSTALKNGLWRPYRGREVFNRSLRGRTVGIIGYGMVARYLVKLLQGFNLNILLYDIKPLSEEEKAKYRIKQVSLEEIFSESDIVSLHVPLNEQTYHMIGKRYFEMMRDDALFVNTARGAVIVESELIEELKRGRIGAVLDVYENEPLEKGHPLLDVPNTLLMPHMAGPTYDLRAYTARALMTEATAFIDRGEALKSEITREMANVMTRPITK